MRLAPAILVLCLAFAMSASAQDPQTAAEVTERGRGLDRILDALLAPPPDAEKRRTLILLVDGTTSLRSAAFSAEFRDALARNSARLAGTRIGVARVGDKGPPLLSPTPDTARAAKAMEDLLATPAKGFQNVYADVRRLAGALAGSPGSKDLVLITLENGDGEDGVEATVSALRRAGVRLSVVTRQAFLSDTYWINRQSQAPRRLDMRGGDAAFVEVPWGWLFQQTVVNEAVPSGFAMYGLSRLASGSGGRVFLYYPASSTGHRCMVYGSCLFCTGDHIPSGESYQAHRLRALAPLANPRPLALAAAGRDPYFQAVLRVWKRASKEGLVRSRPSVKMEGAGIRPQRRQVGRWADLTGSLAFARHAARAEKLARRTELLLADLEAEMTHAKAAGGSPRYRAIADLTRVMLHLTRFNLIEFAAWCREAGPEIAAERPEEVEPPEAPWRSDGQRYIGIRVTSLSLCHGVTPFKEIHLPGGEAVKRELAALDEVVRGFLARHAHTPFAVALHRSGIARFHFTVRGKYVPPPDRDIPGTDQDKTATDPERPARGGPAGGGDGGTPTSGGK